MAMIRIDGVDMPNPSSYGGDTADLDSENSGRASETGFLTRDRIRAATHKLRVAWTVNRAQLSAIALAISPESLTVRFFDAAVAGYTTATMYAGSQSWSLLSHIDDANPAGSLWEITVNFIEF